MAEMVRSAAAAPKSYLYLAAHARGGKKLGFRQAGTPRALAESLRRERLLLLRSWRLPGFMQRQKGLALKNQAELNAALSQLVVRGVPLVEALEVTAETVDAGARMTVNRIRELVAAGSSFSDACDRVGAFDRVTTSVYRAAERTGDLGGAAGQLAATARRQLAVAGKAVTLMIYPAIVMTLSAVVCGLMLTFIVPRIADVLETLQGKIPWFTVVVVAMGRFMRDNGVLVLLALAGALALVLVFRKRAWAWAWGVVRNLPLMRELVVAQELARFFSVMGAMTRTGVPLSDALGVGNGAIGHPVLKKQLTTLRTKLIEGGSLPVLIEGATALPLATRKLLVAAERAGDLESAFATLADDMAAEVERRSSRLLSVLQPALVVFMFLMIGSLVLAIMIPLLTMSGQDLV